MRTRMWPWYNSNDNDISETNSQAVCSLVCLVVVWQWSVYPYPSGLFHRHWGSHAPVPVKQSWRIWVNTYKVPMAYHQYWITNGIGYSVLLSYNQKRQCIRNGCTHIMGHTLKCSSCRCWNNKRLSWWLLCQHWMLQPGDVSQYPHQKCCGPQISIKM